MIRNTRVALRTSALSEEEDHPRPFPLFLVLATGISNQDPSVTRYSSQYETIYTAQCWQHSSSCRTTTLCIHTSDWQSKWPSLGLSFQLVGSCPLLGFSRASQLVTCHFVSQMHLNIEQEWEWRILRQMPVTHLIYSYATGQALIILASHLQYHEPNLYRRVIRFSFAFLSLSPSTPVGARYPRE